MQIIRIRHLAGCNVHAPSSVTQLDLTLGPLATASSRDAGEDFAQRFIERFATLRVFHPPPTGSLTPLFLERLRSGVPFPEVMLCAILAVELHLLLGMQRVSGVELSRILAGPTGDSVRLVWRSRVPSLSRRAARVACLGVNELLPDPLRDPSGAESFEEALAAALSSARRRRVSPSTGYLLSAAEERGLPCEVIRGDFVRLGQGREQRKMWGSVTDGTPFVGCRLALSKRNTSRLLDELGLPVPRQIPAGSAERAVAAAERIGYPVVLKPAQGKKGHGVTVNIRTAEEVAVAYEAAGKRRVIVESFVEGEDHRLLVIDGRFVAAVKRLPPSVTGDGTRTVRELIDELNRDPRRNEIRRCTVRIDHELHRQLDRAGVTLDDVLPPGRSIVLRGMANVSTGGSAHDVTDRVHPDNREMAVRAMGVMGLDIGAVDFLTPDIGVSYREAGGIIELNSRPGLRLHTWPDSGKTRDVAGPLFEMMFPHSESGGHVPIALLVGDRKRRTVARTLDRLLRDDGRGVGRVSGKDVRLDGRRVGTAKSATRALDRVLRDPRVERVVRVVSARRVARRGLQHDRCRVAILLGTDRPPSDDERAGLEVVSRAADALVVAASDEAGREALRGVEPGRITLVTPDADAPGLRDHLETGGRVVTILPHRGARTIVLAQGQARRTPLGPAPPPDAPAPLFSAAAAVAMGVPPRSIRRTLRRRGRQSRTGGGPSLDGRLLRPSAERNVTPAPSAPAPVPR